MPGIAGGGAFDMASRLRKIGGVILAVVVVAVALLAYQLSHESECVEGPALAPGVASMKAVVHRCYGPPRRAAG